MQRKGISFNCDQLTTVIIQCSFFQTSNAAVTGEFPILSASFILHCHDFNLVKTYTIAFCTASCSVPFRWRSVPFRGIVTTDRPVQQQYKIRSVTLRPTKQDGQRQSSYRVSIKLL